MLGPLHSSPQSVSTSRSVPLNSMESESNSKLSARFSIPYPYLTLLLSGTLLVRNGSVPSPLRTTGVPWESCSSTTSPTSDRLTVSSVPQTLHLLFSTCPPLDIRTWHSNIEQHASDGVNKILIGNKSDWNDKRVITEQQGRELAQELDVQFMETSAKVNEGVEEAFFTLARYSSVSAPTPQHPH